MWSDPWVIALLGFGAGALAGTTGIGGVILVPALVFYVGVPVRAGIAAAMMAFVLNGFVGTVVFARHKSIRWDLAIPLVVGAIPSAAAGTWLVNAANPLMLKILIGLLTAFSGLQGLWRRGEIERFHSGKVFLPIGAVTGFLSSLSGTGGAVVLMPILFFMDVPVLTAIGLSAAVQFPIAVSATIGNLFVGQLDVKMGMILAVSMSIGLLPGAKLAHRLPIKHLRQLVSAVLTGVGLFILVNLLRQG